MYWTHLIFALTLGLLLYDDVVITAVKPGYLDFDNLPETNFSCKDKVIGGYYADVETGCQMFHVCTIGQKGEVTDIKFLCLNGTVFDQETRVCERIDEVDCSKSEDFFNLNLELYGNQAGIQPEEEFFCEDCSTENDDEYEDEVTSRASASSTSTTTTTTTSTTTTTTTTPRPPPPTPKVVQHYPTSSPETIAALLALHNAFSQSVQNSKIKPPPPPRVINNAFASLAPSTPKPSYYPRPQVTQLPPSEDGSYDQQDLRGQHRQDASGIQQNQAHQHYGHGTGAPQRTNERQKTNYYQVTTPPSLKSNYHHFQSGDGGFVHSFDPGKQYNYQYYHPRKVAEPTPKASVSIITSTSTSTSVRASRPNVTAPGDSPSGPEDDFPTGYDDYPDDSVDEAFFRDVPKLRTKKAAAGLVDNELSSRGSLDLKLRSRRSPGSFRKPGSRRWHGIYGQGRPRTERAMLSNEPRHTNHRYPDEAETTTTRHSNHRYEETTLKPLELDILPEEEHPSQREEFLQNLLGSLDLEEHDRQKMANLFKVEEKEMDRSDGTLHQLGNKLGDLIMEDVNKTINQAKMEETNTTNEHLDLNKIDELFRHHYEEMSQEVDLKFDLGSERGRREVEKKEKLDEELAQDYELARAKIEAKPTTLGMPLKKIPDENHAKESTRIRRQVKGLDTEKFNADYEPRKRGRSRSNQNPSLAPTRTSSTSSSKAPFSTRDVVPVFEEVDEGDFTTRPYVKTSGNSQRPRLTTRSLDSTVARMRFNYEITTPVAPSASSRRRQTNHGRTSLAFRTHQDSAIAAATATEHPRLATVPNIPRVLDNLKDTPVYEEEGHAELREAFRQSEPEISDLHYDLPQFEDDSNRRFSEPPRQHPTAAVLDGFSAGQIYQAIARNHQTPPDIVEVTTQAETTRRPGSQSRRRTSAIRRRPSQASVDDEPRPVTRQPYRVSQSRTPVESQAQRLPNDEPTRLQTRGPISARRPVLRPSSRPQKPESNGNREENAGQPEETLRAEPPEEYEGPTLPRRPAQHQPIVHHSSSNIQAEQDEIDTRREPVDFRLHRPPADRDEETAVQPPPPSPPTRIREEPERTRQSQTRNSADEIPPSRPKTPSRGRVRGTLRSTTPPNEPPPAPPIDPSLVPDPNFSCEGKIKGSFYADTSNDCKGFFICSQGAIGGPLLKTHFWCGTNTKFNQRSRTCQAEDQVECSVSSRYYHLNQDFAVPETEEELRPAFEPTRVHQ
ncbi:Chitin Hypothetical protein Peritrophin-A domain [Nesidiocoris tenuis]|uniref:Chitin-binding type-2 domain-containing protein n=1 Tax=Nesidiocoris tenuis TaxID=355587 RepID=A0ABN7B7P4_9HEMI|nr:Chitin Hypothetical protein Peritrophin-A domain [Nesidiocoris tenuis]